MPPFALTGSHHVITSINGISVGESGLWAMCAASLGVRAIFGSGDEAFTRKPDLVKVRNGFSKEANASTGDECAEQYQNEIQLQSICILKKQGS